jgi:cathepsin D
MGMAFESLSEYEASPVFQTLVAQGAVDSDSATFGFKFASSGSELFLGGTNSKLYKGGFTWVPISVEVCSILKCVVEGCCLMRALIGVLAGTLR